jgi:hypothetical protein
MPYATIGLAPESRSSGITSALSVQQADEPDAISTLALSAAVALLGVSLRFRSPAFDRQASPRWNRSIFALAMALLSGAIRTL